MIPEPAPGRAERTRRRLLAAGLELFAERGYDATTVAQIAAAAGVTEMTFFRHFAGKEALVVDDPYDPLMAAHVAEQPAELPVLARVARGIRAAWRSVPAPAAAEVRVRLRIAAESPTLRAAMLRNTEQSVDAITTALTDTGAPRVAARVAAGAALAGITEALLAWARRDDDDLDAAIRDALAVLEGTR